MWRRLVTKGPPPSGGSGCHVWWEELPTEPYVEVAATLEVLGAPRSPRVYFWALQATFTGPGGPSGAAHTGLQWNPRHPGSTAVNWGGYHHPTEQLRELDGTPSPLPGVPGDPNTRDYPWHAGRPYRFAIRRGEQGWAAVVTDLGTGEATVLRELFAGGDTLVGAVVWAELFCHCDDPPSSVRWSDFALRTASGRWTRPGAARLNIPALRSGGCDNIDAVHDGHGGFVISTKCRRTAPPTALHRW